MYDRADRFLQWLEEVIHPDAASETTAAAPLPTDGSSKPAKAANKRGRKRINPELTKRIVDAWATGNYKDYIDLARELKIKRRDVEAAIKREDMRKRRSK